MGSGDVRPRGVRPLGRLRRQRAAAVHSAWWRRRGPRASRLRRRTLYSVQRGCAGVRGALFGAVAVPDTAHGPGWLPPRRWSAGPGRERTTRPADRRGVRCEAPVGAARVVVVDATATGRPSGSQRPRPAHGAATEYWRRLLRRGGEPPHAGADTTGRCGDPQGPATQLDAKIHPRRCSATIEGLGHFRVECFDAKIVVCQRMHGKS